MGETNATAVLDEIYLSGRLLELLVILEVNRGGS
jgi:hypothetical protein